MRIKPIHTLALLVPAISACQQGDEAVLPPEQPGHVFTVRASIPGDGETRSQITYGNPKIGEETFQWTAYDWIKVFNVSRLSECPEGIELATTYIDGRVAVFESAAEAAPGFQIKAGDRIFVNYWETGRVKSGSGSYDERDIFTIDVNPESNKPQLIVEHPDSASMSYMQGNLKMYDIVTAEADNEIPDLHFRHLSAIMRVTLRNETGHDFYPKELQFEYPGTDSFFAGTLYCSVDPDAEEGSGLKVYDTPEFYDEIEGTGRGAYADTMGSNINNYTAAPTETGGSLAPGETYNLYISAVPRIANTNTGDRLVIRLEERLGSNAGKWYEMTIDGFDVAIVAGNRYWFNLTAVEEDGVGKLMFTKEWEDRNKAGRTSSGD